jgi:hypothetical protein
MVYGVIIQISDFVTVAEANGRSGSANLKQTKRLFNDSQFEIGDYLVANVLP